MWCWSQIVIFIQIKLSFWFSFQTKLKTKWLFRFVLRIMEMGTGESYDLMIQDFLNFIFIYLFIF